ncbi:MULTISPECIES: M3 family oligoendopeptidase [unclassified Erysipelothrix]|uniref:M3 family oligoendopeptidase n=1 Tax=unclassified Erysipelothrix TaxID=2624170 RepID=UPI0013765E5D|nr:MULTISPECIES: M3 family oligoendopeptidase [unclassified Erysipelothrix]MBK2403183.1 M3 family oligoendopeptidase [Erysipelothrix sp. strain 2 (EsS2-6-Brazil)]MBK2403748.1 M3 family oligoendopeptidase [Erysipelothrix sp. strain 2 (EsS2-7-Brazil)]NBA01486.1 M3 family oligoendopeptidase [Erysipelothrix rhusiopathiae]
MYTWNLDALYKGYDATYTADVEKLKTIIKSMNDLAPNLKDCEDLESFLTLDSELNTLANSLVSFASLQISANASDNESNRYMGQLQNILSETSRAYALFSQFMADSKDVFPQWVKASALVKEHEFILQEMIDLSKHNLSPDVEEVIAKLNINGASAWNQLFGHLTSMTTIEFNGEKHTMASIRNLAYSHDPKIRKDAYYKELELYEKMDDSIAFALNSIKGTVNTISDLRGYESALDKTLFDSRMSKATLDALMEAIEAYLPVFRKYLKHKAHLMNYENGLPWYDLFAPFETTNPKTYTVEDSKEMILTSFAEFSDDLANMAKTAYEDAWIDFLPREGKRSGAFCSNQSQIKQSYVLTNFDGSISDIVTIAHELGHAYHGMMIEDLPILNTSYSMPVAETASTFCENIVFNAALKVSSDEEKLVLIENSLQDLTQIIVDILSRFKFESEVFERRKSEFLFPKDLKEIMIEAQRQSYGDGLDASTYHPYMWACKGHYYSGGLSYYNFPYAFGGLFALGLYAKFEKEGDAFVPAYRNLLKATTTSSCEDVAAQADIDVTDVEFWKSSLQVAADRIEMFIALTQ